MKNSESLFILKYAKHIVELLNNNQFEGTVSCEDV